eukprot:731582-Pelagomonas_calceolata.AAC.1
MLTLRTPLMFYPYLYLDLPKHIVHSVAHFCLHVHALKVELATWNDDTCDLCDAQGDVQDEQHALFKCTAPGSAFFG